MKYHKISLLGGALGTLIIVCSIVRWFFMFYDPSQMILGASIGIIVCAFSYQYNWMKSQEEEHNKINKRLDSFTKWLSKGELE